MIADAAQAQAQVRNAQAGVRLAETIDVLYSTESMAQINLHVTADFEEALEALMHARGLRSKSEAIRYAVQEAAAPYRAAPPRDFSALQGLLRRHPRAKGRRRPPVADLEREIDDEMDQSLAARPRAKSGKAR